jgi:hypothetical protein
MEGQGSTEDLPHNVAKAIFPKIAATRPKQNTTRQTCFAQA